MKRRVLKITILFSLLLAAVTGLLIFNNDKKGQGEERSEQLVDINEISVLMSRENYDEAKQKIE